LRERERERERDKGRKKDWAVSLLGWIWDGKGVPVWGCWVERKMGRRTHVSEVKAASEMQVPKVGVLMHALFACRYVKKVFPPHPINGTPQLCDKSINTISVCKSWEGPS
jgi:hypothetical protein